MVQMLCETPFLEETYIVLNSSFAKVIHCGFQQRRQVRGSAALRCRPVDQQYINALQVPTVVAKSNKRDESILVEKKARSAELRDAGSHQTAASIYGIDSLNRSFVCRWLAACLVRTEIEN